MVFLQKNVTLYKITWKSWIQLKGKYCRNGQLEFGHIMHVLVRIISKESFTQHGNWKGVRIAFISVCQHLFINCNQWGESVYRKSAAPSIFFHDAPTYFCSGRFSGRTEGSPAPLCLKKSTIRIGYSGGCTIECENGGEKERQLLGWQ